MKVISLKDTFTNVVDVYAAARPTYLKELLSDVLEFSERGKFETVLEVGAGTGQATDLFLPVISEIVFCFQGLNEIKRKFLPKKSLGFDEEGIEKVRKKRIKQIQAGGCFGVPLIKEYRWVDEYDADKYALLIESYSSTQSLSDSDKESYLSEIREFIHKNGGKVFLPQHVILYLTKA